MENASKALIMAASVLLGLMIISVGVALFNTFSDFSRTTLEKVEETKIAEWNNNFLKYYGSIAQGENEQIKPIDVTVHDIITVSNFAKQNNENYELQKQQAYNENTYYVQVRVDNVMNFEKLSDSEKNTFIKNNSLKENQSEIKYYECTNVKISSVTKRVMYIEFKAQK